MPDGGASAVPAMSKVSEPLSSFAVPPTIVPTKDDVPPPPPPPPLLSSELQAPSPSAMNPERTARDLMERRILSSPMKGTCKNPVNLTGPSEESARTYRSLQIFVRVVRPPQVQVVTVLQVSSA